MINSELIIRSLELTSISLDLISNIYSNREDIKILFSKKFGLKDKDYIKIAKHYYSISLEEKEEFLKSTPKELKKIVKKVKIENKDKENEEYKNYYFIIDSLLLNEIFREEVEKKEVVIKEFLKLDAFIEIINYLKLTKISNLYKVKEYNITKFFKKIRNFFVRPKILNKVEKEFLIEINERYKKSKMYEKQNMSQNFLLYFEKFEKKFNETPLSYEMAKFLMECIDIYNRKFDEEINYSEIYKNLMIRGNNG